MNQSHPLDFLFRKHLKYFIQTDCSHYNKQVQKLPPYLYVSKISPHKHSPSHVSNLPSRPIRYFTTNSSSINVGTSIFQSGEEKSAKKKRNWKSSAWQPVTLTGGLFWNWVPTLTERGAGPQKTTSVWYLSHPLPIPLFPLITTHFWGKQRAYQTLPKFRRALPLGARKKK